MEPEDAEDAEDWILQQAVVEVRYRRGMVYLDRCGSLMVRLQDDLGEPFEGAVPEMEQAELISVAERLAVRYGPDKMSITHTWPRRPVRVQSLVSPVWKAVSDVLGLDRDVTRCGARFWFVWATPSLEAADERLRDAGLLAETSKWQDVFGSPYRRAFVGYTSTSPGKYVRAALEAGRHAVNPALLQPDVKAMAPDHVIVLDVDFGREAESSGVLPGDQAFRMGPGQISDYFRESWAAAKGMADGVTKALLESRERGAADE